MAFEFDASTAQPEGDDGKFSFDPSTAKEEEKGVTGHARDLGLSALKSAIAVPETVVGLADIPTGGAVGKFLENEGGSFGFRPKEARDILSDLHTDQYKAQQREFQEADGVIDKAAVAVQNPSLIANTVVESAAPMLAGGVAARGIRAIAPAIGAAAAGAAGEGAMMAGSQAANIRQETEDRLLTPEQSGAAIATGALGSLFGYAGGRVAQRLGIGDVDTMLARGAASPGDVAAEIARLPAKSIPRQVIEGAISEGFLEELPQSISEQIIQNLALNKVWSEGVEDAAVMGTLAGMAMGGGASLAQGVTAPRPQDGNQPQGDMQPDQLPADSIFSTGDAPVLDDRALERAGVTPPPPAPVINTGQIDRIIDPDQAPAMKPSERMGLDPAAGPLSAAAVIAVDSGAAAPVVDLQQPAAAGQSVDQDTGEITRPAASADQPAQTPEQMRERLTFIEQQARMNGGWDRRLIEERDRLQSELAKNVPAVSTTPAPAAPDAPTTAPGSRVEAGQFDVSGRTPAQLQHLAANGKAGWKEAAQAEIQRRAAPQPADAAIQSPATAEQAIPPAARWDAMPADERTALLLQKGGWSTKAGALNVIGKQLAGKAWKDVPDSAKARIERLATERTQVGPADSGDMAATTPAPKADRRLDHGELNIPGRTQGIDAELDRNKREQRRAEKAKSKADAQQRKEDKAEARRLFAEVAQEMLEKLGPKLGDKALRDHLDQMVKWEPAKFIALANKFRSEQAASASVAPPKEAMPAAEPAKKAAGVRKPKKPADNASVTKSDIVNVQRSFAGRNAQSANLHALGTAQRRIAAGEDAEAVRQDTGWHRGPDGKWRFEISDDQAQLAVGGDTAVEVLDAAALDGKRVRVADVLDHPKLFAAYPHIADIRVELVPAESRAAGRMVRTGNDARLQVRGDIKRAAMTSVMLHELQHAIQHAEGFARGGSAKALVSDLDRTGADTYRRLAGEVEARNTQYRQRMTEEQRQMIAPEDTADVSASDVIVMLNGKRVAAAPMNTGRRVTVTEAGLLRALRYQFPGLVKPVQAMLAKGRRGEEGGLVLIDSADPLRIAGVFASKTGRSLNSSIDHFSENGQIRGLYNPESGLTFLIGPNLDPVTAPAVLLHEMIHGQQKASIDRQAMDMLMNRGKVKDAKLRAFLDGVAQRMVDAGATNDAKEAAAYIVEQAVTEGRSRGYAMADSRFFAWADRAFGKRLGDFLRSVAAMVRTWMIRHGGIKDLTVDDLVGYAMAGLDQAANGSVTAGNGQIAASAARSPLMPDRAEAEEYRKNLDAALNSLRSNILPIKVMTTPPVLRMLGASALPITISRDVVRKATNGIKHDVTMDAIRSLPEEIANPVMVFESATEKGSLVVLTEHKDQTGRPVMVAISLSRSIGRGYVVNQVSSAYGRRPSEYMAFIERGLLRYRQAAKSPDWIRDSGLQLPKAGSPARGFWESVPTESDVVNDQGLQFSRSGARSPQQIAKNIGDGLKSITTQDVKQVGKHKITDWMKIGLQFLGRRQLVDIYGDTLPLAQYDRLSAQMEADKNDVGAQADDLARRWGKLPDERKLAELMHDATLAQIDADSAVAYAEGDDRMKSRMLKSQFDALTPEAKKVYREARDHYRKHHAAVRDAIHARIERSELRATKKAELLKRMDDDFFQAIKGVYFPLARFGQYVVVAKDAAGKVASVSRAETMAEAEAMRQEMVKAFPAKDGYQVGRVILSKEFVASRDMVGRGFMTELYDALDEQNLPPEQLAELEDTLGQLYLSSLPDLSWAKHGIHRKGTPGFSQDARRAFAQNTFHGARYLAKLKYGDQMMTELERMQKYVDEHAQEEGFDQPAAQRVVDEMNKRHDAMMNPKSNPLSTALTSFGFIYYLGLSPAAAVVNLSQTPLVAYPVLGAKWGFKKAGDALLKAAAESAKGKNDIRTQLKDADELRAYDEAVRSGVIDVTMAHDLAGIAQGEDAKVMWKIRPVMRLASYLFHHAERFNRQATFVAAYRLARDAGNKHEAAYDQAVKATYDGHFDYSAGTRPRVMQGNVAKVVLLFKQYAQNMIYTIARNAYQSVAGESPEVRREARRMFGALMTMHAMAAGVLGLPFVGTLLTVASALGGSDDEPWDAEAALRNMLADAFGPKVSEVIARGFSRLTPWDISGRVGLDKLLLPDVQEGLEGQRWAESVATAMLGPVIGVGVNAARGAQKMADGDFLRGIEDMLPIAARNPIKSYRYWNEGAQDRTGVAIKDEVSALGEFGQFIGFSPSEVRLAFEGRSAVMDQDRRLAERRSDLMAKFARAAMDKDQEGMDEARQEIAAFNQKNPGRRITAPQMWQSVRARQRRINEAEDGVYLPRTRRDALEAGRFAAAG